MAFAPTSGAVGLDGEDSRVAVCHGEETGEGTYAVQGPGLAAQFSQRGLGIQEYLCGHPSKATNQLRFDDFYLLQQMRQKVQQQQIKNIV